MSKDKNWSDLTKKEKDSAKATLAAAGIVEILKTLNRAGKWSVARWWIVFYLLMVLHGQDIFLVPYYSIIWPITGLAILIIFRKKFFN